MSESDADCLCVGGSAYGSRRLHEPGVSRCRSKAELTIKPCTFFCGFKAELILEPMLTLAGPRIGILFGRRIGGVSGAPTSSAQAAESRLRQVHFLPLAGGLSSGSETENAIVAFSKDT